MCRFPFRLLNRCCGNEGMKNKRGGKGQKMVALVQQQQAQTGKSKETLAKEKAKEDLVKKRLEEAKRKEELAEREYKNYPIAARWLTL